MLQRQGIQPNFMTHKIRNFIQAIFNGDNAKLKLFSLIHKRQRIQIKFISIIIRTFKHTMQNRYIPKEKYPH